MISLYEETISFLETFGLSEDSISYASDRELFYFIPKEKVKSAFNLRYNPEVKRDNEVSVCKDLVLHLSTGDFLTRTLRDTAHNTTLECWEMNKIEEKELMTIVETLEFNPKDPVEFCKDIKKSKFFVEEGSDESLERLTTVEECNQFIKKLTTSYGISFIEEAEKDSEICTSSDIIF